MELLKNKFGQVVSVVARQEHLKRIVVNPAGDYPSKSFTINNSRLEYWQPATVHDLLINAQITNPFVALAYHVIKERVNFVLTTPQIDKYKLNLHGEESNRDILAELYMYAYRERYSNIFAISPTSERLISRLHRAERDRFETLGVNVIQQGNPVSKIIALRYEYYPVFLLIYLAAALSHMAQMRESFIIGISINECCDRLLMEFMGFIQHYWVSRDFNDLQYNINIPTAGSSPYIEFKFAISPFHRHLNGIVRYHPIENKCVMDNYLTLALNAVFDFEAACNSLAMGNNL